MKVVLISGSFKKIEIPNIVSKFLVNNIKNINVSFIAADFDTYENNDKYVNKLLKAFKEKNIIFNTINIIDNRLNSNVIKTKIKESNLIFLLGGDTLKQIKTINDLGLRTSINCIKEKGIIMGMSAGAINLAENVVLARDLEDDIPELSLYKGLGFTDINIEPHCDFKNKEHWKDIIEASYNSEIVVMHDNAFIIIDNKQIKFYGDYCILYYGNLYKKTKLEKFLKEINFD